MTNCEEKKHIEFCDNSTLTGTNQHQRTSETGVDDLNMGLNFGKFCRSSFVAEKGLKPAAIPSEVKK